MRIYTPLWITRALELADLWLSNRITSVLDAAFGGMVEPTELTAEPKTPQAHFPLCLRYY